MVVLIIQYLCWMGVEPTPPPTTHYTNIKISSSNTCVQLSCVSAKSAFPVSGSRCFLGARTENVFATQRTHRATSERSHFSGSKHGK